MSIMNYYYEYIVQFALSQMDEGLLNNRREVQCIICPFIHQMFISDPNLAKLVHFQVRVYNSYLPSLHWYTSEQSK